MGTPSSLQVMEILFGVAVLGGAASVLTPCVLPLLPALLVVSEGRSRRGVWGLALGIEASFFLLGILLASALSAVGLPDEILQWLAAVFLAGFGLVLLIPSLHHRFTASMSRVVSRLKPRRPGTGFSSGFLSGLPLGLVWAPCAGPILAGVTFAASTQTFSSRTLILMTGYAAGMLLPLALIILGGRNVATSLKRRLKSGTVVLRIMGVLLIGTSLLIATGGLNKVNRFLAEKINLTSTPTASIEKRAISGGGRALKGDERIDVEKLRQSGYPETDRLTDLGPAPELVGITGWLNTQGRELSIASLRGKVVLLDFWTYSCINCIRTFPHLRAWHDRYSDKGLVVLGVHTPEFAFEKDPANVAGAVKDFDVRYPVALDPDYSTWSAYYNQFWPAHYLIDRSGRIRFIHYGEGAYEQTERYIQQLLSVEEDISAQDSDRDGMPRTPEIYLGYERADGFESTSEGAVQLIRGREATYAAPRKSDGLLNLSADAWALEGKWKVEEDRVVAGEQASIFLRFQAREVYLVVGPAQEGTNGELKGSLATGAKTVNVKNYGLVTVRSSSYGREVIRLDASPGLAIYTFTFG